MIETETNPTAARERCRRAFKRAFPKGFQDARYLAWERNYKWEAHQRWMEQLDPATFKKLLDEEAYSAIVRSAVRIESRTNLLFSFEKMALRDATATEEGARIFARALYQWLHGTGDAERRFEGFVGAVESLPRRQTRVLTWPLITVFGFIALPAEHIFLKPQVTKVAAKRYGFPFTYRSRPNFETYQNFLELADQVREDLHSLRPRDMIDIQSFLWVLGSPEYG
jgi:hypothetical protein